jgi:hypothetical protein
MHAAARLVSHITVDTVGKTSPLGECLLVSSSRAVWCSYIKIGLTVSEKVITA